MEQLKISSHSFKQILGWLIRNKLKKQKTKKNPVKLKKIIPLEY